MPLELSNRVYDRYSALLKLYVNLTDFLITERVNHPYIPMLPDLVLSAFSPEDRSQGLIISEEWFIVLANGDYHTAYYEMIMMTGLWVVRAASKLVGKDISKMVKVESFERGQHFRPYLKKIMEECDRVIVKSDNAG
jgi:hypothetical protein